ncbi:MAG: DUF2177 family protein [Pseudomonadota bacterium]
MEYLASYLATLALFLVIDLLWIKSVMRPIFVRSIGTIMLDDPKMGAALVFFVLYVAGLVFFAVTPAIASQSWVVAALHGALLGCIAYGTYETTNLATLKGWTMHMAVIDVAWGAGLSALASVAGFFVYNAMA